MHPAWPSQELCATLRQWGRDLHRSFLRAPVGIDSDRAASSLLPRFDQRRQERWDNLSIPSTSRTSAAWRGAPWINLLVCLGTPLACAPYQQTPSSHNSWRTRHKNGGPRVHQAHQQGGVRLFGRSEHLREIYMWPLQDWGSCYHPQTSGVMKIAGFRFYFLEVYTPRLIKSSLCDFL